MLITIIKILNPAKKWVCSLAKLWHLRVSAENMEIWIRIFSFSNNWVSRKITKNKLNREDPKQIQILNVFDITKNFLSRLE